jgi:hypothetical protein
LGGSVRRRRSTSSHRAQVRARRGRADLCLLAKVVGRDKLDGAVERCIAELLLGDPDAITATRRMVRRLSSTGLAERVRARDAGEAVLDAHPNYSRRGLATGASRCGNKNRCRSTLSNDSTSVSQVLARAQNAAAVSLRGSVILHRR